MNKIKHQPMLLFFLFFCVAGLNAQDVYTPVADQESFFSRMQEIANITKTIQCSFTQEKQVSFMDEKMVSSGQLYFSGSSKLRWEYAKPYNYAILMVGDQLVIIDEGEVNETKLGKNPSFKKIQQLLTQTLKGDFASQKNLFDQEVLENNKFYRIKLIPKDTALKDFVSQMDVYFAKDDMMLSSFIMDEQGDLTKTTFSDQKINEELPARIFDW
jgi:outer membrane lipoprotein carrier protein